MRTVEVTDEVWAEIAKRGKFGETEDDVLRREFGLANRAASLANGKGQYKYATEAPQRQFRTGEPRKRLATQPMSSFVRGTTLIVEFRGGARKSFALPDRADKSTLRRVREQAVEFARSNGASYGQEMAVRKALTQAGYHQTK